MSRSNEESRFVDGSRQITISDCLGAMCVVALTLAALKIPTTKSFWSDWGSTLLLVVTVGRITIIATAACLFAAMWSVCRFARSPRWSWLSWITACGVLGLAIIPADRFFGWLFTIKWVPFYWGNVHRQVLYGAAYGLLLVSLGKLLFALSSRKAPSRLGEQARSVAEPER